jgi:hypothetical protein
MTHDHLIRWRKKSLKGYDQLFASNISFFCHIALFFLRIYDIYCVVQVVVELDKNPTAPEWSASRTRYYARSCSPSPPRAVSATITAVILPL